MKTVILLFGVLAEEAGTSSIVSEYTGDLEGLKKEIEKDYPAFAGYDYKISVNKILADGNSMIKEGDEVAFLPPFAGG